jgi:hypothetical protein
MLSVFGLEFVYRVVIQSALLENVYSRSKVGVMTGRCAGQQPWRDRAPHVITLPQPIPTVLAAHSYFDICQVSSTIFGPSPQELGSMLELTPKVLLALPAANPHGRYAPLPVHHEDGPQLRFILEFCKRAET